MAWAVLADELRGGNSNVHEDMDGDEVVRDARLEFDERAVATEASIVDQHREPIMAGDARPSSRSRRRATRIRSCQRASYWLLLRSHGPVGAN